MVSHHFPQPCWINCADWSGDICHLTKRCSILEVVHSLCLCWGGGPCTLSRWPPRSYASSIHSLWLWPWYCPSLCGVPWSYSVHLLLWLLSQFLGVQWLFFQGFWTSHLHIVVFVVVLLIAFHVIANRGHIIKCASICFSCSPTGGVVKDVTSLVHKRADFDTNYQTVCSLWSSQGGWDLWVCSDSEVV